MSQNPDERSEREQRLSEARAEIQRERAQGRTIDRAELLRRYPDLGPELESFLAGQETVAYTDQTAQSPGTTTQLGPRTSPPASNETVAREPTATLSVASRLTELASETVDVSSSAPDQGETRVAPPPSGGSGRGGRGEGPREPEGAGPGQPLPPGQRVRYIGDYELLKVLGQGGMGVVYKARQLSLNRPVALKMIRNAEFAGPEQLQRFQNEAEAVAHLDHPGIVPIYEVGIYEDQRYFSMKLIEGEGLDKNLTAYKNDPRRAARLMVHVAEAIYHAHQRGILHRDLKPANILVDSHDQPHVTDFGLAKRIEGDAGLTVSGAIMGTPAYMAPEQALGRNREVTTATDVYGLGAILYTLSTGQAPFSGNSVLETLEQVRQHPPEAPTRRNADLPRDLEVICLKCLAKDPARRYQSAQALAEDLQRWLNGEPIKARPVGPATQAWMWCKRNPALATLTAALAVALVGGVVGIMVQWREAVSQRTRAEQSRDQALASEKAARAAEASEKTARAAAEASEKTAQAARAEAESNAQLAEQQATLALNTVQRIVVLASTRLQQTGTSDVRKAILDTALDSVGQVSENYEKSTSKEATTAAIHQQLGLLFMRLGQSEKAWDQFQNVLEITRERVKIKQGSDPSRKNLAAAHLVLGELSQALRRDMKASLEHYQECLRLWQEIHDHPKMDGFQLDRKEVRAGLAEANQRVATTLYRLGDIAGSLDPFRRALNLRRELVIETPDDFLAQQNLGYSLLATASVAFRLGKLDETKDYYERCLELRQKLARERPDDDKVQLELSDVYYMLGEFLVRKGDNEGAVGPLRQSREIRQALVDKDPKIVDWQRALSLSHYWLGTLAERLGETEEAHGAFSACREIRERLARDDPNNNKRQMEWMLVLPHVGEADKGADLADQLAAGPTIDNELWIELGRCYAQCARAVASTDTERSQTFQVKAMEALRAAVKNGYRDRIYLQTEPDLEPLRDRSDFQDLLNQLPTAR